VKVVIPLYRATISEDEKISLATVRASFHSERICFLAPESLSLDGIVYDGEGVERFLDEYFQGITGYNRLLTSSIFYERFLRDEWILICQLDCLVFRDDLLAWIEKKYDYIAPPWFVKFLETPEQGLWRVGNGGFSLRNVRSALRVLCKKIPKGFYYPHHGSSPWETTYPDPERGMYERLLPWYVKYNPLQRWVTIEDELRRFPRNEDLFWAMEAPKFDPSFRVASAEEALPFAFEMSPRWCYEQNGFNLPFGCHAWARYDRDFWWGVLKQKGMV
jgi:hypothetical protein